MLIAARVAPATRHIGFVPTAITTHTEPFHLSKAIATLDYVSAGRAGIRVQVAARAGTAAHFGRREIPPLEPDRLADPDTRPLILREGGRRSPRGRRRASPSSPLWGTPACRTG